jgi:hypothetical protein
MGETCERCKKPGDGRHYHFYYGKHLSTSRYSYGGIPVRTEVTTRRYSIGGMHRVFLCGACVRNRALLYALYLLLFLLPFVLFKIIRVAYGWHEPHGYPPNSPLRPYDTDMIIVISFWSVVTLFALQPLISRLLRTGAYLAIQMKRPLYKAKGFDRFFREDQYRKLKK